MNYDKVYAKIVELPSYVILEGRNSPTDFYTIITLNDKDLETMGIGTEVVVGGSDRRDRLFRLSHNVWVHESNERGKVTVFFYVKR